MAHQLHQQQHALLVFYQYLEDLPTTPREAFYHQGVGTFVDYAKIQQFQQDLPWLHQHQQRHQM